VKFFFHHLLLFFLLSSLLNVALEQQPKHTIFILFWVLWRNLFIQYSTGGRYVKWILKNIQCTIQMSLEYWQCYWQFAMNVMDLIMDNDRFQLDKHFIVRQYNRMKIIKIIRISIFYMISLKFDENFLSIQHLELSWWCFFYCSKYNI
jgi:hypothetical protein